MSESIPETAAVEAPIGVARVKAIVVDAVRHALPLIPFYFYHGSVPAYLLLTAFDLALGLMLIVGTTRDAKDPTTVDPRATGLISRVTAALTLAVFLGMVAAILTIPLGIPAFISGMVAHVGWIALVTRPGFYVPVALMALSAGCERSSGSKRRPKSVNAGLRYMRVRSWAIWCATGEWPRRLTPRK